MDDIKARTVAIDIQFKSSEADTEYVLSDGTCLAFKSETFDYILCNQVFEHIPDTERLAAEMSRVLKTGGEALITFPNRLAPTKPHPTPRWASYLPRSLGEQILPLVVSDTVFEYYVKHEVMLSPMKARYCLSKHFNTIEYATFKNKERYREERLATNTLENPTLESIRKLSYDVSPYVVLLERIPFLGKVPELVYPGVRYICTK